MRSFPRRHLRRTRRHDARRTGRRPRVLVATARCVPEIGGIETHVEEVSRRLVRDHWDLEVLTTDRGGRLPRRETRSGIPVRRFRALPAERDWYASPGLGWALLRADADLVHVQGIHTLVPPLAMLVALVRRIPYVVTFHTGGNSSAFRTRMRGLQFRLLAPLLRRADALVGVSRFEGRRFDEVTGLGDGAVRVVRNGGTLPEPAGEVAVDPDLVVSIGRLERYKGHHRAVEALPRILEQRPGARLLVLGSGPYEAELRALAERLGVADRVDVRFVPPVERDTMATLLAGAGVVTLLSDYEAHPVAVMEALGLGRPAVVLRTSGLTELAEDGWVRGVDPGASAAEVADAILAQLDDPVRVDPAELPDWESSAAGLAQVYADVLGTTVARATGTEPGGETGGETRTGPGTEVPTPGRLVG